MDPLLKLLLHDTLTPAQARVLREALDAHVEELERWAKAFPEDAVGQASLRAAWDLQAKVFAEEVQP